MVVLCSKDEKSFVLFEQYDIATDLYSARIITHENGMAYHMINENESANLFADKALTILPNSAYELSNKANALKGLGKLEEANQYYDLALKMTPDVSGSAIYLVDEIG
jgi:tetratricopeptide (TPR) repeat protein